MISAAAGSPNYCSSVAYNQFLTAIIRLDSTDALLRAAYAVSKHAFRDQQFSDVTGEIDRLVHDVEHFAAPRQTPHLIAALNEVLFEREGFGLATSEAPIFSYLPQVLNLKVGCVEAVSMIYHVVADRLHVETEPVQLLNRFCIRARCDNGYQYIDLTCGRSLSPQEARMATAETRLPGCGVITREGWLRRILRNLQAVLARGDYQDDLAAVMELQNLLSLAG